MLNRCRKTFNFQLSTFNLQLKFRHPAGTSRGVYTTRNIWYVVLTRKDKPHRWGIGECAPLPALSCDYLPNYAAILSDACRRIEDTGAFDTESLRPYPSILFGLETAFRHYQAGSFALWDTPFSRGEAGIPINGLIWMDKYEAMKAQIETKMKAGFRCIKLKIGAINFDEEMDLLRFIRRRFPANDLELRVDANGAFSPDEALDKLNQLAGLHIHSIEQPICAGYWEDMARLAKETPLPIALDEELIGCNLPEKKRKLLETIRPQYIILKPSLHGGISGCNEWIAEAERLGIGWWITSALESNIGLNAIAQWCATLDNPLPQGLGTGGLYINNVDLPLEVSGDCLWTRGKTLAEANFHLNSVQTSGSTGEPKTLPLDMDRMKASARLTCSFLGLKPGDTALLCMDLKYIGAKMMLVRTAAAGLNLLIREPSGHPLADVDTPLDFAAMAPLQVYNSLQAPEEKERLKQIKNLLIGGGAIDPALQKELYNFPHAVYSTYGMTETLSHIALRRLNGAEASDYYTPFPAVSLSLSEDDTLIIDAPLICGAPVFTRDMAELNADGSFRILGRKDNIINTGGVKIQIEKLEEKIRILFGNTPYAITSAPDKKFGEIVVLLVEDGVCIEQLQNALAATLLKYEQPRFIRRVSAVPITASGKINRPACKNLALK
jgi:o-succinylbenzoate synthase